jgi:hypothetical protein
MAGMDDKLENADALQVIGIISMIASLVLGLVWVFTEWLA